MLDQDSGVAEPWLGALQELTRRAAHEVKNALNGVAVNLEVVRTRLDRAAAQQDPTGTASAPFARAAAEQLEQLSSLTEALLALARAPGSGAADLAHVAGQATRLADAIARADGRRVHLDTARADRSTVAAPLDVTRWVLVRLLLDALASEGRELAVAVEDGAVVRLTARDARLPALDAGLVASAAASAVEIEEHGGAWLVRFPGGG